MKNIKCFKHVNIKDFDCFLNNYGYKLDNVVGFGLYDKKQYCGNILKTYIIYLNDGEHIYFKVAYFKSFIEFRKRRLEFPNSVLSGWYWFSNVKMYKLNDKYVTVY